MPSTAWIAAAPTPDMPVEIETMADRLASVPTDKIPQILGFDYAPGDIEMRLRSLRTEADRWLWELEKYRDHPDYWRETSR